MKNLTENTKSKVTVLIIILATLLMIIFVENIPYISSGFSKPPSENYLPLEAKWIVIFLIADLLLIGTAAGLHKIYSNDYSKIKSIYFFSLFGGITGALIGEFGNIIMILPYIIIMGICAFLYKKFRWWKVVLTTYLLGIIIENIINRSPLQSPTLLWISLLTYPYFFTKIWENRTKIPLLKIIKDLKHAVIFSVILAITILFTTRENPSPPLVFLAILLPFMIKIGCTLIMKNMKNESK